MFDSREIAEAALQRAEEIKAEIKRKRRRRKAATLTCLCIAVTAVAVSRNGGLPDEHILMKAMLTVCAMIWTAMP